MRERHARYYLALTEAAEPELLGPRPLACLERLEVEHGNLRAALGWYLAEDAETEEHAEMGLRLAASLGRFWNTYGPDEGRRWLEKGLVRSGASPTPLRARALSQAGFIAIFQGDPGAMSLLEEGLALSRELGDQSGLAISISTLGHAVAHSGDHERLRALRDEAGTLLLEPLDRRARAHLLLFLAVAALSEGDHGRLEARTDETLILFRELEDIRHVAMSLGVAGISALEQGDPVRAAELFEEDLRLLRELRDKTGIVYGLLGMAGVAALRGQSAHAARLWAASEVLREVIGLPPPHIPGPRPLRLRGLPFRRARRAGRDDLRGSVVRGTHHVPRAGRRVRAGRGRAGSARSEAVGEGSGRRIADPPLPPASGRSPSSSRAGSPTARQPPSWRSPSTRSPPTSARSSRGSGSGP